MWTVPREERLRANQLPVYTKCLPFQLYRVVILGRAALKTVTRARSTEVTKNLGRESKSMVMTHPPVLSSDAP